MFFIFPTKDEHQQSAHPWWEKFTPILVVWGLSDLSDSKYYTLIWPKWRYNTFFVENPKIIELVNPIFFGRRYDGMKGFPAEIRPENRYSAGDRKKTNYFFFKKNRFFRFFQKLFKSIVNIEFCLKNTLNTPRGQFLPYSII